MDIEGYINKRKLSYEDTSNLSMYYRDLAHVLLGHQEVDLKDSHRLVMKEMINDGLSEAKIKAVFTDINGRIAPKTEGTDEIIADLLKEPEIKKMVKKAKSQSLAR